MGGCSLTLRFQPGAQDVAVIRQAVARVMAEWRRRPPARDADGRLLVDLSALTGDDPIDLDDLLPGCQLAQLDLTRLDVAVTADTGSADAGVEVAEVGTAADRQDLMVVLSTAAAVSAVELLAARAQPPALRAQLSTMQLSTVQGALRGIWFGVFARAIDGLVGEGALGAPVPSRPVSLP